MKDMNFKSEVAQQLLSDHVWKLHNRAKPSFLTYVIQQVESQKAHKTLRSAERALARSTYIHLIMGIESLDTG